MPTSRQALSTSALYGTIYAIGGYVPGVAGYPGVATVEVYDPATDTWTTAPDLPTGRFGPRTSVVDGRIYVIGGIARWITTAYETVEEYDPGFVPEVITSVEAKGKLATTWGNIRRGR